MDVDEMDLGDGDGVFVNSQELLALDRRKLVDHLRMLASSHITIHQVTLDILKHIHASQLPPLFLTVWLPIAVKSDPKVLRLVLSDTTSQNARKIALSVLKGMARKKSPQKSRVWDVLGGTRGLTELLEVLAPRDIKTLMQIIASNRAFRDHIDAREADALIAYCLPGLFAGNDNMEHNEQGLPRRQIRSLILLLHLASDELLTHLFNQPYTHELDSLKMPNSLCLSHTTLLRKIATGQIAATKAARENLFNSCKGSSLKKLVESNEAYEPLGAVNQRFSDANLGHPAIPFTIDLLEKAPDYIDFALAVGIIKKALDCATTARTPFDYIFQLLESIVAFINSERTKLECTFDDFLPFSIFRYWAMSLPSSATEVCVVERMPINHPSRPTIKHREPLEHLLQLLLSRLSKRNNDSKAAINLFDRPVRGKHTLAYIPKSLRLDFTKLYCRLYYQIDLEQEVSCGKSDRYLKADADLFHYYNASDAQWIYQRLEVLASSKAFINFSWIFSQCNFTNQFENDMHYTALVKAELESLDASVYSSFPNTKRVITLYQTCAERSSSTDIRKQYVCAAIELATRSECLPILQDVTVWSERFLNDPRVSSDIHDFMCSQSYVEALSCVSFRDTRRYTSLESLKELVVQANSILDLHIDFIVRLSQTSFFRSYNYGQIDSNLLCRVVKSRASKLRQVQRQSLATAEELGNLLLGSMKPALLKYESIGLTDEFEGLDWDDTRGPLRELGYVKAEANAILPFLDDLARARDALWEKTRREKNPGVSLLSHLWPKGLPVQWLLPNWGMWSREVFRRPKLAPYIYERAQRVIFFSAETAQTPLPDLTEAIGVFVDDLIVLIPSYLQSFDKPCLGSEAMKLLRYYENLLGHRSHRYRTLRSLISDSLSRLPHWQSKKVRIKMGAEVPYEAQIRALPTTTDSETRSWNPIPDYQYRPATSSGGDATEILILDCLLKRQRFSRFFDNKFRKPKINQTEPDDVDPPSIWINPRHLSVLPLKTQESTIVAALLILKRLYVHQSDSSQDHGIEYRSLQVHLDDAFLSQKEARDIAAMTDHALQALKWTINVVAPKPLRNLAESMLQAAAEHAVTSRIAFKLLSLLLDCDQPQLASDLIMKSLQLLPEQSTWHQCVIDSRVVRYLCNADGHLLAKGLVDHVRKALNERKEKSIDDQNKPVIKVLTVKTITRRVAQLANPETARSLLTLLFKSTRHSDIRGAVLNSLIDLIADCQLSNPQQSREAFQTLVSLSYVAGDPSEKTHISERIWKEAEAGGDMPMVNKERPMMDLLLVGIRERLPEQFCETYVNGVVLPVLHRSTENCNRWMRIYLNRLPLSEEARSITDYGPFATGIVDKVMREWPEYLPRSFLLNHRSWALSYIQYSRLIDVNRLLKKQDKDWEATNAGKAWESRWEDLSTKCTFTTLAELLISDREPLVEHGITQEDIMRECCERACLVLQHPIIVQKEEQVLRLDDRPFQNMWDVFLPKWTPDQAQKRLKLRVLNSITAEVDRLRVTARLSGGASYATSILPPPYVLDLFLIPFLYGDTSEDNALDEAMQKVVELINQCAADGANIQAFREIEKELSSISSEYRARAAALLGTVPVQENITLPESLRIKLASGLLSAAKAPLEEPGVKTMLETWTASQVGWVQTQGLHIQNEDIQCFVNDIILKNMKTFGTI